VTSFGYLKKTLLASFFYKKETCINSERNPYFIVTRMIYELKNSPVGIQFRDTLWVPEFVVNDRHFILSLVIQYIVLDIHHLIIKSSLHFKSVSHFYI